MVAVAVHIVVLHRVLMAGLVVVDRRVAQEVQAIRQLRQTLRMEGHHLKVIVAEMGVLVARILVWAVAVELVGQERLEPLRLVALVALDL
jgi:hypothetical protein